MSKPNGGLASARNAGCEAARGDYIALLDADDLCTPERIGAQVNFMRSHPTVQLCGSDFSLFDESGTLAKSYAASYYSRLGRQDGGLRAIYDQQVDVDASQWAPLGAKAELRQVQAHFGWSTRPS